LMKAVPLSDHFPTPFDDAVRFLANSSETGGIHGLEGSAPSFVVAAAAQAGARTILMVLPDSGAAVSSALDIRFYLGEDEAFSHPLEQQVIQYPASDVMPYSFAGLETDVWIGRMASLFRLNQGRTPRVITIGLDALIRKIVPRTAFSKRSFTLAVGQELDRDELLNVLVSGGYSRAPLVEDAGDFSVRGFIIDLYSPLYPFPVRIEQMGDRIESIRFFDPSNQRSRDDISEVLVGPVHMLIPDEEERKRGIEALVEACEERGVEKRVRQRLVDDFRHGVRFPGAEFYLPYFFSKLETLLDYLPIDTTLVLPDRETLARAFEDLEDEISRGWESASAEGFPVPGPEDLYLSKGELSALAERFRTVIMSPLEVEEPGRRAIRVQCVSNSDVRPDLIRAKAYDASMSRLVKRLEEWRDEGNEVFLASHTQGQAFRLLKLLEPYSLNVDFRGAFDPSNLYAEPTPGIRLYVGALSAGFRMPAARRIVLTEEEVFGSRVRTAPRKRARGTFLSSLTDLVEGEAVVHEDYGIGIFRGLARKEFDGVQGEVMVIEYAGGDLLYHPLDRLQVIQKYVSGSEEPPRVDRLGGKGWIKTKTKVQKSIREMARELLEIYAKRQVSQRKPYSPPDENFTTFEAAFEFEETPDQARAIQDVMESMDSDKPMDRLVCGDVGYGKTEVALRAAFRAIMEGRQVAVLVPTTVLAQQHFDTFTRRFNGYPINVEMISRFRNAAEQKVILKRLEEGKLDLVIGTHRLLQKDVAFRDLGLLVVDEEQRFGVVHKEKIKKFKAHVDVLTLTATPIPRTLNLSLSGIRDLSVIETPPTNRQSIRTHVMKQTDEVIREALVRELNRGGQAFYLHNRVQTIYRRATALQKLVPEARFGVAHGQMADRDLERVMLDFITGKINVLVSTSIIESGLDIPRANTMIIERADTFGLSDLYQLRGRVGRSHLRAYAYFLTPPETLMTPDAVKRLAVIQEYSNLGQGFRIAMRDMEIRGAGNILGTSQSGHVGQVGYEMYLDLLEEAVQEMKGEKTAPKIDPEIRLKLEALLPEDYVPDPQQRMNLYKRLSRAAAPSEIDEIEEEILDLYGKAPIEAAHLIQVMRIRLAMKEIRIVRLDYTGQDLVFTFDSETPVSPQALIVWAQQDSRIRLLPSDRLAFRVGEADADSRINQCFELLESLRRAIDASASKKVFESQPVTRLRKARGLKNTQL
jgi:transcription-repair coupling factor (superfamily II helicase)